MSRIISLTPPVLHNWLFVIGRCCHPLRGKRIRVSYIGTQPYVVYGGEEPAGVDIDVVRILSEKFRFAFDLVPEERHGSPNATGHWSGMVESVSGERKTNLLILNEVDLSIPR